MDNPNAGSMAVAVFAVVCAIMAGAGIVCLLVRGFLGA